MQLMILTILAVSLAGCLVGMAYWAGRCNDLLAIAETERSVAWQHGYDAHARACDQANQWRSREEVLKLREEIKRLTELAYQVPPQEGFRAPGSLDLVPVTWKQEAEASADTIRRLVKQRDAAVAKVRVLQAIVDLREAVNNG